MSVYLSIYLSFSNVYYYRLSINTGTRPNKSTSVSTVLLAHDLTIIADPLAYFKKVPFRLHARLLFVKCGHDQIFMFSKKLSLYDPQTRILLLILSCIHVFVLILHHLILFLSRIIISSMTFVFRQMPDLHRTQYDFRDGEERGLHLTDSEQILQHSESFTTGQFLKEIRGYFKVYRVSYNTIVTFPRERFPA